jgi:hypothetical protein
MCGNGEIVVEIDTPDHGWGGRAIYSAEIQCEACAADFMVYDGGVVRRSDEARRDVAVDAYNGAVRELMQSSVVQDLLADVASYLDQKPSIAAVFRSLEHQGLAEYSKGHFTKRWRGGAHWAQEVRYSQMRSVLALMERSSAEIEAGLEKIAALKELIPERQILRRVHPDVFGLR